MRAEVLQTALAEHDCPVHCEVVGKPSYQEADRYPSH
jgi:hypothetical protein